MLSNTRDKKRRALALRAFLFAFLSCALGLSFGLIKSPQSKSEVYLATAMQAQASGHLEEAAKAAVQSVRLNPSSVEGWKILSGLLQQKGQYHAARQAQNIAMTLQHDSRTAQPLYAMPAELRLSLLSLGATDI